jgi:hypothetical protein
MNDVRTEKAAQSCDNGGQASSAKTLHEMMEQHRAVAKYRIYLFEPRKPRGEQKTYIEPFGLKWDEATTRCDALNAELKAAGINGFTAPSYGVALENGWECMTPAARSRQQLLGKGPKDFTLV